MVSSVFSRGYSLIPSGLLLLATVGKITRFFRVFTFRIGSLYDVYNNIQGVSK